jgi:predicted DNA-binding ribbon-helix-helix protein
MSKLKKRSVILAHLRTSVSLEDEFWHEFVAIAKARRMTTSALACEIYNKRDGNLSSAIRVYVLLHVKGKTS